MYLAPNLAASPHLHEAFRQGLGDLGYVEAADPPVNCPTLMLLVG